MEKTRPTVSVIVPCLNEEGNIQGTVATIDEALRSSNRFSDYEILIFNDGSTDKTGEIADSISKMKKKVRVIHNLKNMGFGYNYTEGVRQASKEFIIMVPGDNEIPSDAIKRVFSLAGSADIVIPYTANPGVRPLSRRLISRLFVVSLNVLFGMRLRYYNGTCMIKSSLLKNIPLKTRGFAYMASILVRLVRSGASFVETGVEIKPRDTGKTKAFRIKNIVSVVSAIVSLFWEVRVKDRGRYKAPLKRIASEGAAH